MRRTDRSRLVGVCCAALVVLFTGGAVVVAIWSTARADGLDGAADDPLDYCLSLWRGESAYSRQGAVFVAIELWFGIPPLLGLLVGLACRFGSDAGRTSRRASPWAVER